eukprot:s4621_g2.t1
MVSSDAELSRWLKSRSNPVGVSLIDQQGCVAESDVDAAQVVHEYWLDFWNQARARQPGLSDRVASVLAGLPAGVACCCWVQGVAGSLCHIKTRAELDPILVRMSKRTCGSAAVSGRIWLEEHSSSDESSGIDQWVVRLNRSWRIAEAENETSGSASLSAEPPTAGPLADDTGLPRGTSAASAATIAAPRALVVAQHLQGICNPCVFYDSLLGCDKGVACNFCHSDDLHQYPQQHRPRKGTRDKFKERIAQCFQQPTDEIHPALQALAERNPYVRGLIRGFLDEEAERRRGQGQPLEPGLVQ